MEFFIVANIILFVILLIRFIYLTAYHNKIEKEYLLRLDELKSSTLSQTEAELQSLLVLEAEITHSINSVIEYLDSEDLTNCKYIEEINEYLPFDADYKDIHENLHKLLDSYKPSMSPYFSRDNNDVVISYFPEIYYGKTIGDILKIRKRIHTSLYDSKSTLVLKLQSAIENIRHEQQVNRDIINNKHQKEFEHIQRTHQRELAEIDLQRQNCENEIAFLQDTLSSTQQTFPVIADLVATAREEACLADVNYLRNKKNPAYTAADKLRMYAAEIRQWSYRAKLAENQIAFYEDLFPWLEEFKEISPRDALEMVKSDDAAKSAYDHYKNWLSPSEYENLSQSQRNQLALDRYKKRKKSNWEIGIEYERYVGYKYELRGFHVSFIGATHGLEDMGRDLVAQKGSKVYIIQCKRWAQEKTIHEKHIFQLYGTAILYEMNHPKLEVCPLFVTTADLSDTATKVADHLHITIVKNYVIEDYPLIKCNIAHDGEKIYHLPFDQQYDNIIISPDKGEGYAYTIEEAESKGFRHAFKWHSC